MREKQFQIASSGAQEAVDRPPTPPEGSAPRPSAARGLLRALRPQAVGQERARHRGARRRRACSASADVDRRRRVAFVCFCLAASGTYLFNDAVDVEADRRHPTKRYRPIAAGVGAARTGARHRRSCSARRRRSASAFAVRLAARSRVVGGYVALTVLYSIWLKHEAVLDLAVVASGFVLRAHRRRCRRRRADLAVVPHRRRFGSLFMVTGKRHAEHVELAASRGGAPRSRWPRTRASS